MQQQTHSRATDSDDDPDADPVEVVIAILEDVCGDAAGPFCLLAP